MKDMKEIVLQRIFSCNDITCKCPNIDVVLLNDKKAFRIEDDFFQVGYILFSDLSSLLIWDFLKEKKTPARKEGFFIFKDNFGNQLIFDQKDITIVEDTIITCLKENKTNEEELSNA